MHFSSHADTGGMLLPVLVSMLYDLKFEGDPLCDAQPFSEQAHFKSALRT